MNAAENRSAIGNIPHGQSHMVFIIQKIHKPVNFKIAILGRKFGSCHFFYQFFMFLSVFNQFLDIADFHALFSGQLEKIIPSGHSTIGIHDFAAKAGRLKTCQTGQV